VTVTTCAVCQLLPVKVRVDGLMVPSARLLDARLTVTFWVGWLLSVTPKVETTAEAWPGWMVVVSRALVGSGLDAKVPIGCSTTPGMLGLAMVTVPVLVTENS